MPIRVALVDDHDLFVEGMRIVLEGEHDFEVVGTASDKDSTLRLLEEQPVDVLVLDVHIPGTNVIELVVSIRRERPGTKVLILSADHRRETVIALLTAGADAFVTKDAACGQVTRTARILSEGGEATALHPPLTEPPRRDPEVDFLLRNMSWRERQILTLIVAGHSNRRIAEECCLALNTVRTHVQNILVKLGAHSKLEAAALAVQQGIVTVSENSVSIST